jgi:hypothetical protein
MMFFLFFFKFHIGADNREPKIVKRPAMHVFAQASLSALAVARQTTTTSTTAATPDMTETPAQHFQRSSSIKM